jgi:hypothetical protein
MPIRLRQMKENRRERGIMIETINVVLQLNMKRETTRVTNKIPSMRL